jgi:hypothetical protein
VSERLGIKKSGESVNKCMTLKGDPCQHPLMEWYGLGPHPGVCTRHATAEQKVAALAALDIPVDIATADPAAVFPEVSITPQRLVCEFMTGWVAKIRGTNEKYVRSLPFALGIIRSRTGTGRKLRSLS